MKCGEAVKLKRRMKTVSQQWRNPGGIDSPVTTYVFRVILQLVCRHPSEGGELSGMFSSSGLKWIR
jgi:hypothetical protein